MKKVSLILVFVVIGGILSPLAESTAINHGPRAVCPEITWLGLRFPETHACQEAVVDCPESDDTTGVVRFKCGCEHGTWMNSADLSNCTHRWVAAMQSDIEARRDSVEIATNMLTRLQTNVAEGNLYGGDVTNVIEASEQLVPLAHSQLLNIGDVQERIAYAQNFTNLIGQSGDQLLSNGANKAWEQLDVTRRVKKASNLMTVLELSLALLTDNMPAGQQALGFENWASKVETKMPIITTASFAVPRTRTTSTAADSNAPLNATSRRYGPSTIVEFEGFSNAPIMQLPNFDVLSASAIPASPRMQTVSSDTPQLFATAAGMPEPTGPTKVGFFMYNSIGSLLSNDTSTIINSRVMGAFVNDPTVSVSLPANQPVNFTFYHLRTHGVANPRCVFWDPKYMTWSQNGCTMVETSEKYTLCSCNHLTSFAILMDVNDNIDMITGSNAVALDIITIFGCALSAVCLIATILIFTCFRSLYSVRHSIHRNLCMCLLAAEIFFVIGIDRTSNTAACRGVAIAMHYLFLAAFCWMLLEGYQLYMMLIQVFEPHKSRIYLYYLFGYGCPAIIVAISAGITWQNYGTLSYCWINVRSGTIWAFIAPVIVVIVANLVVLGIALRVVLSVKSRERSTAQRIFGWLKGSATLLCLLGITWVFGFLAAIPGAHIVFAYVFCILNCFQGVLIFVLHCVLNDKVINALMRAARKSVCCCGPDLTNSSMAGYSSARTGTTFFSRHRLLNFFKHDNYQGSTSSAESTDSTKNAVPSPTPLTKSVHVGTETSKKDSPEVATIRRLSDWKSHTAASYQGSQNLQHQPEVEPDMDPYSEPQLPDRPTIRLPRPSIRPSMSSTHRNSNGSSIGEVSLTPRRGLLRVDPDTLENRHSAPVKRKKFPLGSTEQERIAELRGGVVTNPQSQVNVIVEHL
uniref:Latrophilin/CL-1-like GPS domain protein n=1 Tax=Panagrellus redivivus TaxID=6233 RepID=A0A7E4VYT7_PANRE